METWEHWQNITLVSFFLAYMLWRLWLSIVKKQHRELHWRIAYVIAFALGLLSFAGPVQTHRGPWRPPTLSQFLAWPAVLLGPILVASAYAVYGELRSKRNH